MTYKQYFYAYKQEWHCVDVLRRVRMYVSAFDIEQPGKVNVAGIKVGYLWGFGEGETKHGHFFKTCGRQFADKRRKIWSFSKK